MKEYVEKDMKMGNLVSQKSEGQSPGEKKNSPFDYIHRKEALFPLAITAEATLVFSAQK